MIRKIIVSIVAAAAAFLPAHQSQAKDCRGVYEMTSTDETNFNRYLAWNDPNIRGILVRETWAHVETALNQWHWNDLDSALATAKTNNKNIIISIACGTWSAPSWIYTHNPPAGSFTLSAPEGQTVAPWDSTAQGFLRTLFTELSNKYDGDTHVVAITMWCGGDSIECGFCSTSTDKSNLDTLATSLGYGNGGALWLAGAKAIVPMFGGFVNTDFYLATGNPYPDGRTTMQALVTYFNGYWGTTSALGLQSNGLSDTYPNPTSQIFPHCNTTACDTYTGKIAFQMAHAWAVVGNPEPSVKLTNAKNHHARWVELYDGDINRDVSNNSENGIKDFNTYADGLP